MVSLKFIVSASVDGVELSPTSPIGTGFSEFSLSEGRQERGGEPARRACRRRAGSAAPRFVCARIGRIRSPDDLLALAEDPVSYSPQLQP